MSYLHALLLYETITPLHVGCGQDVGVVDLPVIRDRTTEYPFIPGSGVRGSLRDAFKRREAGDVDLLFGPEAGKDDEERYAGCVATHDAKILLFPVRSDRGVFLWITCPAVLARFAREVEVFLPEAAAWRQVPQLAPGDEEVLGPAELAPAKPGTLIYLEEYAFGWSEGKPDAAGPRTLASWLATLAAAAGVPGLGARTVLVSDRTFHHFVTHATLVLQHNRLTSAKTVEGGALFAVEAVPPQALFYGFLGGTASRRKPKKEGEVRLSAQEVLRSVYAWWGKREAACLHLGGDEGTGLGVTRIAWVADEGGVKDATAREDGAARQDVAEAVQPNAVPASDKGGPTAEPARKGGAG